MILQVKFYCYSMGIREIQKRCLYKRLSPTAAAPPWRLLLSTKWLSFSPIMPCAHRRSIRDLEPGRYLASQSSSHKSKRREKRRKETPHCLKGAILQDPNPLSPPSSSPTPDSVSLMWSWRFLHYIHSNLWSPSCLVCGLHQSDPQTDLQPQLITRVASQMETYSLWSALLWPGPITASQTGRRQCLLKEAHDY